MCPCAHACLAPTAPAPISRLKCTAIPTTPYRRRRKPMAEATTQREVKVMRDTGPILGYVEDSTHTPWTIVEADTRERVRWKVIVYAPEACDEDLPLIFGSREDAIAWVERNDCAKG